MKNLIKRFKIDLDYDKVLEKFFTRMGYIFDRLNLSDSKIEMFCYELGINLKINQYNNSLYSIEYYFKNIDLNEYFLRLQLLLNLLYDPDYESADYTTLKNGIENCFLKSELDLTFRIKKSRKQAIQIFPKGARLLDEKLVDDNLDWLEGGEFTEIYTPFDKGLKEYTAKDLENAITQIYKAVENTAKMVCGNNTNLKRNKNTFITKLNLEKNWKQILHYYIEYANDIARHSKGKTKLNKEEVEAFIYLSGIIIRLAKEKIEVENGYSN